MQDKRDTISGRLAAFAVDTGYDDLPEDVRRLCRLVLLDTLGCALAGSRTEEVARVRAAMAAASGGSGGDTLLWGSEHRLPLPFAALANGTAAHVREIDDFGGCAHSGSVVIPAALGAAVRAGRSGRDLLAAIAVGYDVARRAMDGGGGYLAFKKRGWHSTITCGGFGAAAAAGRLLGLDAEHMQWALGYAGSNAGGTWAFIPDGAMSKRVHPGLAALSGIVSACLAAEGVTAPTQIFEAEWGGFFNTYVPGKGVPEETVADLGSDFRIRLVGFKPYAACRGIHSSVDAVLGMRRDGLRADEIEGVTVRGSAIHVTQLSKQSVETTLDAQMSLPYAISVALLSGGAGFDQFDQAALRRPEVRAFAKRVNVVREQAVADGEEPFVDIALKDGRVLTDRVLVARGDATNPLGEDELRAKFRSTAGVALPPEQVEELENVIDNVAEAERLDALVALLAPRTGETIQRRSVA